MTSAATDPHGADPHSEDASARVAELFERHARMVYGICRTMLRDVQEAEDATQQAFLSAHRALLTGTRVRDSGAWMATIARNECRSRIADRMRTPLPIADDDLAEVPQRVDEAERLLQAGALRSALDELPERQREAVVLRYVYGLRYGEVAKALGLSRPATEALLFRARRTMRVRLRHVAAAALAVPFSVREEIALALPGFEGQRGTGGAAVGIAGGLLAKLAAAPTAAKIATATLAVSTVGAVGTVESDRPVGETRSQTSVVGESPSTVSAPVAPRGREAQANDVSGASVDDRDSPGEAEGTSTSQHDDRDAETASRHVAPGRSASDSRSEANTHDAPADARGDATGTEGGHPRGDDGGGESPSTSSAPVEPSTSPSAVTGSGTSGSEAEGTSSGSDGSGSSSDPSGSSGSDTSGSGESEVGGSSGSGSSSFGSGEERREGP